MTCQRRPLGALLAIALLAGAPAPATAGLRNFVDSFVGLLDTTNTSMSAAGDKLKAGLKEGKVKQAMADFGAGLEEAEAQMAPKRAAVWESLKDLPMWIPQAIKHTWKQFVGALKKVVGVLLPGGGGGGGGGEDPQPAPPADPPPADPPPSDPPADPPGDGEGEKPPADDGGDDAQPDEPAEPAPEDGGDDAQPEEPAEPAPEDGGDSAEPEEGAEEDAAEEVAAPEAEISSAAETPVDPAPEPGDEEEPATRASADMWEAAKQGFRDAERNLQFETYGRLGALLAAEEGKQTRGRKSGVLDERASKVLLDKLDEVRSLHSWMAQHLAEILSQGEGLDALGKQMKALGPQASQKAFGPVVREARRRSQRRTLEGPAAPGGTPVRLGKILGWMSGK